jgi:hypothetical protein
MGIFIVFFILQEGSTMTDKKNTEEKNSKAKSSKIPLSPGRSRFKKGTSTVSSVAPARPTGMPKASWVTWRGFFRWFKP